jgi:hypothetical protein
MRLRLRKLAGLVSIIAHPGYSGCKRCYRRWAITKGHHTMYSDSRGCFPLCKDCWGELTPETRLPFYRQMYDGWASMMVSDLPPFSDIRDAVMRGE